MFLNKRKAIFLISVLTLIFILTISQVKSQTIKIVDGDTIHLNGEKIRFTGIDTPELKQTCLKYGVKNFCGVSAKQILIYKIGKNNSFEIIITEIGGCIGDIESLPFFEAVRQAKFDLNSDDFLNIHLTLIPYLSTSGELKTKPTQHSVKKLLEAGIQPDILVCRSEHNLGKVIKNKLALFCNVSKNSVIVLIFS